VVDPVLIYGSLEFAVYVFENWHCRVKFLESENQAGDYKVKGV